MNGQRGSPPGRSGAGGLVLAVLVVLMVIGVIAAHAARSVQVVTCTNTVTPSCTEQTVPLQTQGP